MDHTVCKQAQLVARKVKKQHGKDEFDRVKQAEKKKRRLEKALATSAAIRAELEKKKQKRLEEQQRLDEEGAAIAEAVALHVLLGEDSDDTSRVMLGEEKGFKIDLFTCERTNYIPRETCASYTVQGIGCYGLGDSNWSVSYKPFMRDVWDNNMGISADLMAAKAVSSLQISENADRNACLRNDVPGMTNDLVPNSVGRISVCYDRSCNIFFILEALFGLRILSCLSFAFYICKHH